MTESTSRMTDRSRSQRLRAPVRLAAAASALSVVVALAGCGSSSSSSTPTAPASTTSTATASTAGSGNTGVFPAPACDATDCFKPAAPESGTAIPAQPVSFGFRAPADNAFYFIAGKQGYFKNVGINVQPQPYGIKESSTNAMSLVLSGTTSLGALCGCELVPTLANNPDLAMMVLTDEGVSLGVYAAPNAHLKPLTYYLAQGMPIRQALHAALLPLTKPGSKIPTSLGTSTDVFTSLIFKYAGLPEPPTPKVDDGQGMALARSGAYQFYDPAPAPLSEQLASMGWTNVVNIGDVVKAGFPALPVQALAVTVGLVGSKSWVNAHPNTMLRFYSVVLRTIHAVQTHPAVLNDYAPYLNGLSGTTLTASQIGGILGQLDPIAPWETLQKTFFTDAKSPYYYKNFYGDDASALQQSGALPQGQTYKPDNFVWAGQIYQTLKGYETATNAIIGRLAGKKLTPAQTALVAKARSYQSWYDFLDAYRAAKAAAA